MSYEARKAERRPIPVSREISWRHCIQWNSLHMYHSHFSPNPAGNYWIARRVWINTQSPGISARIRRYWRDEDARLTGS
jgi:hypothetical protein